MANSRTSNSLKNIASNLGLKFLMLGLQFATRTLFIYNLGTAYNGINSLLTSILSFLNIAELGIGSAIVYAMYKPIADDNQEKVTQYLEYYKKIYHTLGLVVLSIGIILAPFLPSMMKDIENIINLNDLYIIYALYLIQSSSSFFVYAYRGGFLTATQKEYKLTPINYVASVLIPILQGSSLIMFKGIIGFCIYTAIPIFISITRSLLNGIFIAKWYPYIKQKPEGTLKPREKKAIFKNTYGLAIAKICTIINNAIDSVIISAMIGVAILGKYYNYQTLILMVTNFVEILFSSIRPSIGNLDAKGTTEDKKRVFGIINFSAFAIYGFCSICYFTIVQPFITIWIGARNLLSIHVVIAIVLNFLTSGLTAAVNNFREGCGLYFQGRYRPIFTAISNIIFSIILGHFFGIPGIIYATIISRFITIWWFDAYIVFKHTFNEKPYKYLRDYIIKLLLIILIGMLTYWVCSLHHLAGIYAVIANFSISLVTVSLFIFVFFFKNSDFIQVKNLIISIIKKKNY